MEARNSGVLREFFARAAWCLGCRRSSPANSEALANRSAVELIPSPGVGRRLGTVTTTCQADPYSPLLTPFRVARETSIKRALGMFGPARIAMRLLAYLFLCVGTSGADGGEARRTGDRQFQLPRRLGARQSPQ